MGNVYRLSGTIIGNAAIQGSTDRLVTISTGDDILLQFTTRIPVANTADYAVGTVISLYLANNSGDKATLEGSGVTIKKHREGD